MIRHAQYKLGFWIFGALCLAFCPRAAQAQSIVTPTVTQISANVYHYNYSIASTTSDDLFDISIHVLPGRNMVFNVSAPTGFVFAYDSGLGLVDYLEDSSSFTATPLSGFTYDSFLAPRLSVYDANRLDLNTFNIVTTTSATFAAVPEPGCLALFGSISISACFAVRKRRPLS